MVDLSSNSVLRLLCRHSTTFSALLVMIASTLLGPIRYEQYSQQIAPQFAPRCYQLCYNVSTAAKPPRVCTIISD